MKHDTSLPTQPCPLPAPFFFLTRICCTLTLNFLHYISHIFSSWNSNCLGPCVFFSHVKIQKSHIIKTHNCCGSIKRELKRKGKKKILKFIGKMYCTSVFLLYNQMASPQSPFPVSNARLIRHIQGRSATRQGIQNKPFIIWCPLHGR